MTSSKLTLIERFNIAVKKNIRDNVPDITDVPFPPKSVVKSSANKTRWKNFIQFYRVEVSNNPSYKLRSNYHPMIHFKYINDEVGVGVFALRQIGVGLTIPVFVYMGKSQKHEVADGLSALQLKTKNINTDSCFRVLYGSLSFLNHACFDCSNCLPYDFNLEVAENATDKTAYKIITTKRRIEVGEELTISYSESCNLPCRLCEKITNIKINDENYW